MKPDIPINPEQRWEWLKFQLRLRQTSLAQVADELQVTRNAVLNAKYSPYPRMERAIAKRLGLSPVEIWPERWNADGTPVRQRPNRAEKCATLQPRNNYRLQDSDSNAIAHRQMAREA
ncbi:helix-turn-helix domain-containing protein [Billgrantia gudaonensis]|uniref:Transcriptional regulator, Nlp family n=1 Tax=Billgrantia gudaonensis TaxID=376427 RepID=A0A1G9ATD9_9GAMM|nr:helix-turn-helix domain-containing protein [Halomonas gudaonensis]SDK30596.1 transcriptional regulator, Nlp family [Halomonas gudaonensis]